MRVKADKWTPGTVAEIPNTDIWEWRPNGAPCTEKHIWVRYISMKIRECTHCGEREALWADFGILGRPIKPD
jgi:hypothetical protein